LNRRGDMLSPKMSRTSMACAAFSALDSTKLHFPGVC
jgi:hypothetical protein